LKQLIKAFKELETEVGSLVGYSKFYRTAPWGKKNQEDFINVAVELRTKKNAQLVLEKINEIEFKMGRKRDERWGPRIIDIDIIFFNKDIIDSPTLIVPHESMQERNFVLIPMMDICADYVHPHMGLTVEELYLKSKDDTSVILL